MADQVVVVEVLAEAELPASEDQTQGYRGRSITLEVLETIWSRRRTIDRVELTVTGWQFDEGSGYTRLMTEGRSWPEVGMTFLLPLFRLPNGEWSTFGESSMVEVVDNKLEPGSISPELAKEFEGAGIEEFKREFLEVEPDSELESLSDYDPVTRLRIRDGSMSVGTSSGSVEDSDAMAVASTTTWPSDG